MNDALHLLTGAYAVNALDPDERAEFEAHLEECPDCAAEVRGLTATTARLASAETVVPPARLKAAVLAQIATTRQLAPDHAAAAGEAPPAGGANEGVVVPLRRPAWSAAQRVLAVAAAFLAVLVVGLSALLVQSTHARNQVDATQQQIARVLTAPDARTVPGSLTSGGKATVVVAPSLGASVFLGSDLPAAPAGHTYELWYLGSGGSAVPAGTFDPDSSGHATAVLHGAIDGAAAVGVTVEPAGGSSSPTTKPVLALQLPT